MDPDFQAMRALQEAADDIAGELKHTRLALHKIGKQLEESERGHVVVFIRCDRQTWIKVDSAASASSPATDPEYVQLALNVNEQVGSYLTHRRDVVLKFATGAGGKRRAVQDGRAHATDVRKWSPYAEHLDKDLKAMGIPADSDTAEVRETLEALRQTLAQYYRLMRERLRRARAHATTRPSGPPTSLTEVVRSLAPEERRQTATSDSKVALGRTNKLLYRATRWLGVFQAYPEDAEERIAQLSQAAEDRITGRSAEENDGEDESLRARAIHDLVALMRGAQRLTPTARIDELGTPNGQRALLALMQHSRLVEKPAPREGDEDIQHPALQLELPTGIAREFEFAISTAFLDPTKTGPRRRHVTFPAPQFGALFVSAARLPALSELRHRMENPEGENQLLKGYKFLAVLLQNLDWSTLTSNRGVDATGASTPHAHTVERRWDLPSGALGDARYTGSSEFVALLYYYTQNYVAPIPLWFCRGCAVTLVHLLKTQDGRLQAQLGTLVSDANTLRFQTLPELHRRLSVDEQGERVGQSLYEALETAKQQWNRVDGVAKDILDLLRHKAARGGTSASFSCLTDIQDFMLNGMKRTREVALESIDNHEDMLNHAMKEKTESWKGSRWRDRLAETLRNLAPLSAETIAWRKEQQQLLAGFLEPNPYFSRADLDPLISLLRDKLDEAAVADTRSRKALSEILAGLQKTKASYPEARLGVFSESAIDNLYSAKWRYALARKAKYASSAEGEGRGDAPSVQNLHREAGLPPVGTDVESGFRWAPSNPTSAADVGGAQSQEAREIRRNGGNGGVRGGSTHEVRVVRPGVVERSRVAKSAGGGNSDAMVLNRNDYVESFRTEVASAMYALVFARAGLGVPLLGVSINPSSCEVTTQMADVPETLHDVFFDGGVTPLEFCLLGFDVLSLLIETADLGVCLHDVKESNVLVRREGARLVPKLIDFEEIHVSLVAASPTSGKHAAAGMVDPRCQLVAVMYTLFHKYLAAQRARVQSKRWRENYDFFSAGFRCRIGGFFRGAPRSAAPRTTRDRTDEELFEEARQAASLTSGRRSEKTPEERWLAEQREHFRRGVIAIGEIFTPMKNHIIQVWQLYHYSGNYRVSASTSASAAVSEATRGTEAAAAAAYEDFCAYLLIHARDPLDTGSSHPYIERTGPTGEDVNRTSYYIVTSGGLTKPNCRVSALPESGNLRRVISARFIERYASARAECDFRGMSIFNFNLASFMKSIPWTSKAKLNRAYASCAERAPRDAFRQVEPVHDAPPLLLLLPQPMPLPAPPAPPEPPAEVARGAHGDHGDHGDQSDKDDDDEDEGSWLLDDLAALNDD